ncbi:MAG: phosphodiester glycosidase family protein [Parasporobacterium sp.]|nr:phosphodiester glycosidase family protein [Parasporobacterium sp.]
MKKSKKRSRHPILATIGRVLAVLGVTVAFVLLAAVGVVFLLLKGPSQTAKTIFTVSCYETSAMKWVPKMFISQKEYDEIIDSTRMVEVDDGTVTDTSMIDIAEDVTQDIELIDVVGSSYKGKLLIVHDPSRVFLGTIGAFGEYQGEVVQEIAAHYDGVVAGVNGGDFVDMGSYSYTAQPLGLVISNGEIVFQEPGYDTYHIAGFTQDNHFFMGQVTADEAINTYHIRDCVYTAHNTGPFLVMDGEAMINEVPDSATYGGGKNPRTAIGQRADGAVLLLVVDGRQADSLGATFKDLAYAMLEYGAVNACAMDGGTSSQMVYNGEVINHPYSPTGPRRCPDAWLVR